MEQKNNDISGPVDVTKTKVHERFGAIKQFIKKRPPKKRLILVSSISAGVLAFGVVSLILFGPTGPEPNPEPKVVSTYVPPPATLASPLTGVMVEPELAERPVTGVMIENSIDARPQSGLQEAGVVFEAIAEGGITRFLALYQESKPANIGPIRSARPYYVQWAASFDARYVHSGGSGEALALIQSLGLKDLDHGKFGEQIASRVSSRFAPHNVFTSMDRIDSVGSAQGYNSSDFTAFKRKEPTPPTETKPATAKSITFNISGANYNTAYTYDASDNSYARVMAGRPHNDQDSGKQIKPKVVVALVTTYGIHQNRIHSVYGTTGTGEIIVFQDGKASKGTWKKESATSSLILNGADGKPMALNAGQTWITAIPSGRVSYTP